MRCIKELAMAEPLVDTVEPNQVRSGSRQYIEDTCSQQKGAG
jgi:hypothetical protein